MANHLSKYEEVFHQAYTHGLEAIYTLQTVDLSSIRRVSSAPAFQSKTQSAPSTDTDPQLTFDFGFSFNDWIKPLWLNEPIRVLGLSANAHRGLVTYRKFRLGDLVELDFRQLIFGKHLGQGHIDEIQQKLSSYVSGREKYRTRRLDIASWVRGLCGELETKCAYLFCEQFGLQNCCPVTIGELGELKRATPEMRLRWKEEASQQLRNHPPIDTWKEILASFIIPWMRCRQGIATYSQLTERLQQVSLQSECVDPLLKLLSELLQCSCPFAAVLHRAETQVFCDSARSLKLYRDVLNRCRGYFSQATPQYAQEHLMRLVAQEMAKRWEQVDDLFIDRCLRLSHFFDVRKLAKNGRVVRMAL